ncbi:hypothetical protein NDU88_002384 [Pleurodeles waltl]|uniref:Uncharacterized protein n=1 Tax=Pleurodeles waltl TaxID=8319 RepID=A0AAV7VAE6_PLEWA|nr:hypothetical protein NDU88_002384 [Pleurodeles waltl]
MRARWGGCLRPGSGSSVVREERRGPPLGVRDAVRADVPPVGCVSWCVRIGVISPLALCFLWTHIYHKSEVDCQFTRG